MPPCHPFVLGADKLLGDGGLISLLDGPHALKEPLVAAVLGHPAQLEHAAGLDVAPARRGSADGTRR